MQNIEYTTSYAVMWLEINSKEPRKDELLKAQTNMQEAFLDLDKEAHLPVTHPNKIAVIYEDHKKPFGTLSDGLELSLIPLSTITAINGKIGSYTISATQDGETQQHNASFLAYCGDRPALVEYDALFTDGNLENIKEQMLNRSRKTKITKSLLFNPTLCDYTDKETPFCTACIDACESKAIVENLHKKTLHFSFSDCVKCQKCVSVCPSGAVQSSSVNLDALIAALQAAQGRAILIATELDLTTLNGLIFNDTLIFVVSDYAFLNELYLSLFAFKTGGRVYFADAKRLDVRLLNTIDDTNAIFALFGKKAVGFVADGEELNKSFEPISARFENMSLRSAVKEGFFRLDGFSGLAAASNMFSQVTVNARCTVCMACAFVCKNGAFCADEQQQALTLNQSMCTGCKHCESVCPEKAVTVEKGFLQASKEYFSFTVAAKDEFFCCVECGKPFASKKAIDKVTGIFSEIFLSEEKKRTLYCCADCKPKIMLKELLESREERKSFAN